MEYFEQNYEIVVARYNENINWLEKYKKISIIYNKGNNDNYLIDYNVINLPNYGRESHTYLYHIINNYDNLKEQTIFTQGSLKFSNEIKHNKLDIDKYLQPNYFYADLKKYEFEKLKFPIKHFGKWKKEYEMGIMNKTNFTCYTWLKNFLDFDEYNSEYIDVAWGAIFSIKKSVILKKPKIFYEHLLRFIDYQLNPEIGHFFERSWHFIFHNNYQKKKIIKVNKLNNINILKDLDIGKNIYHYITNIYQYNKYQKLLNDIIIYPNTYLKTKKNNFNFKFNDVFYIKINIDENNILILVLSHNFEYNLVILNNTIINKVKANLMKDFNNFNLIIVLNKLKVFINEEIFFEEDLKLFNTKNNNIKTFIKTNNYQNNIKFDDNLNINNLKFIIIENLYFNINKYYQTNFLNYFIDYSEY